ncbi:MAG: lysylphosphatidylglycerol synthase transmembrane domain-containing protein [bacterium]|nr:lysylphosphatidylglycerol synthase transmembrane domain-containing protein [bacterium]
MRTSKLIRLTITLLVVLLFATYFLLNTEKFKPLLHVNLPLLLAIGLTNIAVIYVNGLFMKSILIPFNKFISSSEAFYISVISSIGNFFATAGTGFGIRAVYLKKKHGLPYSEFITTLSGNYVLVFLINSFIGLAALYLLRNHYNVQYLTLAVVFGLILIASLALSLMKLPLKKDPREAGKGWLSRNFYRVVYGWSKITSDKKLMFRLIGLVSLNFLLAAFIYWAIIKSVHLDIGLPSLLLFTVLGSLAIFINITPANLGVKEAIYLFSSSVLGFSVSEILLIVLVERGVQFSILFVLWLFTTTTRTKDKLLKNGSEV